MNRLENILYCKQYINIKEEEFFGRGHNMIDDRKMMETYYVSIIFSCYIRFTNTRCIVKRIGVYHYNIRMFIMFRMIVVFPLKYKPLFNSI